MTRPRYVMAPRRLALIAGALAALAGTSPARAADAEAQALFDEGKRLIARGDVAAACERFERSQRIEPAGGTLLHLASCRESEGKTATAWTLFNEALSAARTAGRKDREQVATERIAALERQLVRLRIVVPPSARVAGLGVLRDGKEVDAAGWDVAVPVDPGPHEVEARAPGRRAWSTRVDARAGTKAVDVEVPVLAPDESADAPPPLPPLEEDAGDTRRTLAVVAAGVGVVGIAIGSFAGLRSMSMRDDANRLCGGPPPRDCPREGVDAADDALTYGTVSTVAFVVGAAGLVGGAVLWFTAPTQRALASSLLRGRLLVSF
ncbi:MAG: hypothetical protein KF795_20395 [Labilithrix sp.]|nr:hypothetical protein [Labilithrix sp.]MBX3222884.1 hypothetical protein [Labilithrix sp.]